MDVGRWRDRRIEKHGMRGLALPASCLSLSMRPWIVSVQIDLPDPNRMSRQLMISDCGGMPAQAYVAVSSLAALVTVEPGPPSPGRQWILWQWILWRWFSRPGCARSLVPRSRVGAGDAMGTRQTPGRPVPTRQHKSSSTR